MKSAFRNAIGILGGTFNPVHIGHLLLAQSAVETYDLSTVILVPCNLPPHKPAFNLIPERHRMAMIEAAIEGDIRFSVSDMEIRRGGISFAVDTAAELRRQMPETDLYFIVGADTLPELHLWKDIYTLLSLYTFAPFTRPGIPVETFSHEQVQLDAPWPARLLKNVTTGRGVDVSSSDIRHRIAEGMSIRYLVPAAVEMYIAEHSLYR